MTRLRLAVTAAVFALGVQSLMADQWNKMTKVTFSRAVEVPGAVLPAGSYIFKLDESNSNRHIVKVQNMRQNKTYATILAIPDYRINASSKTVMYFGEKGLGSNPDSAVAIKSWFYPGDNYGQRFVYPKAKATQIAKVYNTPVATQTAVAAPTTQAAPEVKKEELVVTTPKQETVVYEQKVFEVIDSQDTAGVDGEAVKAPAQTAAAAPAPAAEPAPAKKLPATNSPIFMIGGLGALLLAGSGLSRYISSRLS
jgi:hypothetical protein